MRLVIMMAILAFPIAEIWILISLANIYGWWVVLYLVVMIVLGLQLIRNEKDLLSGYLVQSLIQSKSPAKALFGSARNILAGILLIIPGVITDIAAAVLLLIPLKRPAIAYSASSTNESARGFEPYQEPQYDKSSYEETKYQQSQYHHAAANHRAANDGAANDDVIEGEFKRED